MPGNWKKTLSKPFSRKQCIFLWKIWLISIKRCKLVGSVPDMKISLGMERVKESSLNGCLGVFVSLIIHIIFFVFYKNYHCPCVALIWQNNLLLCRVKPQYNKHLHVYTKVLGIMNYIFCPSNSKIHDIMKPRYDEKVWPFIISGFHSTNLGFFCV